MKKIIALILATVMIFSLAGVAGAAEPDQELASYLWDLSTDMNDDDFRMYALRNFKFIQSIEPIVDADTFFNLYAANTHLKQKKDGAKEEFIEAQNNIILTMPISEGVIFLWDKENIPAPDGEEISDEDLDAAPLDGVGFVPLMVKYLIDDPSQAKGNILALAGGAGKNRSNSGESYPAAEVFNDLGYNVFVVQYRIAPYSSEDRYMDLQRAVRLVKYYAAQEGWGGQDMIAAAGWSAGAMTIMGMVNNLYGDLTPNKYSSTYVCDDIDAINSDLDVAMPIYGGHIDENCENPHIPALYCCVGSEDNVVGVEGEQKMYEDALAMGALAMLRIFEGAGHGFGVGQEGALKGTPECAEWPAEADAFMQENLGYSGK